MTRNKRPISFKTSAQKDLKKIDHQHRKKIALDIIAKLSSNPYAGKKLQGRYSGLYRLRVGNYRIRYSILKNEIAVIRVGHRQGAYNN